MNRDLAYRWFKAPNKAFSNRSPIEVVKSFGIAGMVAVSAYLDEAACGGYVERMPSD